jgi:hypothetical protein
MSENETEDLFCEVQNEGMTFIGTRVEFEMDGKAGYYGVINDPDEATQMMTGGYQGRAEMVIIATRSQFAGNPGQKGVVTITAPDLFAASQWNRKQVEVFGASHYAIHLMKQMPTQ